jgi:hypothetical protein
VCFFTLISGIVNLIGASVPACCRRSAGCLFNFSITSALSLVVRFIVAIILGVTLESFNQDLDDYDTCISRKLHSKYDCSKKYINGLTRKSQETVNTYCMICLVVTALWLLVSLVGLVFGCRGFQVEKLFVGQEQQQQHKSTTKPVKDVKPEKPTTTTTTVPSTNKDEKTLKPTTTATTTTPSPVKNVKPEKPTTTASSSEKPSRRKWW